MAVRTPRSRPGSFALGVALVLTACAGSTGRTARWPSTGSAKQAGFGASGLVAYLPLDGEARDLVSGRVAVSSGVRPVPGHDGLPGSGLGFDGAGAAMLSGMYGLPQGNQPRTIALWFRSELDADWRVLAGWGSTAASRTSGVALAGAVGGPQGAGFTGYYDDTMVDGAVFDRDWHHLAATYDGASLTVYVDGVPRATRAMALQTLGTELVIGRALPDHPFTYFLRGALDELFIFQRALSAAEVQRLMGCGRL